MVLTPKITVVCLFFLALLTGCANKKEHITLEDKKINTQKTFYKNKADKHCIYYLSSMRHATSYIKNEFNQAYFNKMDFLGAKAQLFLVKNDSSSIFAKNINKANISYKKYFLLAKKNKCNTSSFKTFPLVHVENKINVGK